jgi:hypothetical protein
LFRLTGLRDPDPVAHPFVCRAISFSFLSIERDCTMRRAAAAQDPLQFISTNTSRCLFLGGDWEARPQFSINSGLGVRRWPSRADRGDREEPFRMALGTREERSWAALVNGPFMARLLPLNGPPRPATGKYWGSLSNERTLRERLC